MLSKCMYTVDKIRIFEENTAWFIRHLRQRLIWYTYSKKSAYAYGWSKEMDVFWIVTHF